MNLIDLVPGVTVLLHGTKRIVDRVAMHPSGTVVVFKRKALARCFFPYTELVNQGAEVVA